MTQDGTGALYFEIRMDNRKLRSDAEESQKIIKGVGNAALSEGNKLGAFQQGFNRAKIELDTLAASAIKSGSGVQKFFSDLFQGISIQKDVVKSLETNFKEFNTQVEATAPGKLKQGLVQERAALRNELDAEKGALAALDEAAKRMNSGYADLTRQLRFLQSEMIRLEQAGQRDTVQFREMEAEASRLSNSISGIQKTVRDAANSGSAFRGLSEGIRAVSGAFAAGTGVVSLFTGANENLQRIQVRLQSAMAITMGLQELSNTLDKNSTFSTVTLTRAKTVYTAVLTRLTAALGGSAVAAKALMASLTLGLSVAIGAAVAAWDRYTQKQEEAARKLRETMESEGEARAAMLKSRMELDQVISGIEKFNGTKSQEKKKIEELNSKYGETFGYYKTLGGWYDVLKQKGEDYINVILNQARAQQAANKIIELENQKFETQQQSPRSFIKWGGLGAIVGDDGKKARAAAIAEIQKEIDKAQDDLQYFSFQSRYYSNSSDLGNHSDPTTKTKVDDPFLKLLDNRKKQYEAYAKFINSVDGDINANASKQFQKLLSEGDSWLDYLQKTRTSLQVKLMDSPDNKEYIKQLAEVRNQLAEAQGETVLGGYQETISKILNATEASVIDKLNEIARLRSNISDDDPLKKEKVELLDKESDSLTVKMLEAERSALEDTLKTYAGYLSEKLEFDRKYAEERNRIMSRVDSAGNDQEKAVYLEMIDNLNKKREELSVSPADKEYKELLKSYESFEEKRKSIAEKYDKEIAAARAKNNKELEQKINQKKNKEIGKAALDELTSNSAWSKLFNDVDELSRNQIKNLLDEFEKNKDKLVIGLDKDSLDALKKKLKEAENILTKNNPFGQLAKAIQEYKEGSGSIEKVGKAIGATAESVGQIFGHITQGLQDIGVVTDKATKDLIDSISKTVEGLAGAIQGYFSGNYSQMAGGIVQMVVGLVKLMDGETRRAEKNIEKISLNLKQLETLYASIQYKVNNALGEDRYKEQLRLINNLIKQREKLLELERAEREKKASKQDNAQIEEWRAERDQLQREIFDIQNDIKESVLQTSVKSLAQELGDAIVDAFARGEDAAEAWGEAADRVIQRAVQNAIVLKVIEKPLQKAIDRLYQNMGFNEDGTGEFDGITPDESKEFKDSVNDIGQAAQAAFDLTGDIFKNLDTRTGLNKGITGLTQNQGDELNGRFTAIQGHTFVTMNSVLSIQRAIEDSQARSAAQLQHLANIDANTYRLHELTGSINSMKSTLEIIVDRGVKML